MNKEEKTTILINIENTEDIKALYIECLEKENKKLKEKISKAKKIINEGIYCDYGDCCTIDTKKILQVLEGDSNE